jgi:predicted phage terminase large subunit-like protein
LTRNFEERVEIARKCQDDFYFFSRYVFKMQRGYNWQQARHHSIICDAMYRVYNGDCKRLIINIPPRYSKTQLAVVYFMSWALGKNPDSEFIHSSYSGRLAANNSYAVRGLVQEEFYREIFPDVILKDDSKAKDEWRTDKGGCVYAVGAGGTITGYGAGKVRDGFGGAIILDDMHKADEARSEVMRNNVMEWFQNTLESRKNSPHTPIIVIMQRLHENDLAGWLLAGNNGEQWEHIKIPAINPDGTALWPEKHSIEKLKEMEYASPYVFSGQYMQDPSPSEGGLFKPDQLQIIDAIPAGKITWCRGWDLASVVTGDWTAGVKLGKMQDGRFIIADVVKIKALPDERDAAIKNTAISDGRGCIVSLPQDPGQAGKSQVLYLTRSLSGFRVKSSTESGDKVTRAEPIAAQINVGNVFLLRGEWNQSLKDELRFFPFGTHDDQVDALSRASMEIMGKLQYSF